MDACHCVSFWIISAGRHYCVRPVKTNANGWLKDRNRPRLGENVFVHQRCAALYLNNSLHVVGEHMQAHFGASYPKYIQNFERVSDSR